MKKYIALVISILLAFGCMPGPVFAETEEVVDFQALLQEVEDACAKVDEAQAAFDQAKEAVTAAKADFDQKKKEAEDALAEASAAEEAAAAKQAARDAAFQAVKDAAEQARDDAQTAYDQAADALAAAVSDLETKSAALDSALEEKTTLNTEIGELENARDEAQALVDSLPAEIETARQQVKAAEDKWAQDQADAADAVQQAQAAYDAVGYNFLNSKINALGSEYYDLPEMIEVCKTYSGSDSQFKYPVTFHGNTITTLADAANDSSFLDYVKSHCTKDNLLMSMDMIDRSNEIRAQEGKTTLKVSYQLMGVAIMSNSFTLYSRGHTLFEKNGKTPEDYADTNSFWAIGPAETGNENLYYYSGKITDVNAPYAGWYDEEKEAMQKAVDSGQWPGLTMEMSTRDVWTNYPKLASQVGHYLTLKNEEYKATGAAITYNTGEVPTSWRGRATQSFNDDTVNSITVDQCRSEINAAYAGPEATLESAIANQQALEEAPAAVTAARAAYAEKQAQLKAAQATLAEKNAQIEAKTARLAEVTAEIEAKEAAKTAAENLKAEKAEAEAAAKTLLEEKKAAYEQAQAASPEDPSSYESYQELKDAVSALEAAVAESEQLKKAAAAAEGIANTAKDAWETAKGVQTEKEKTLKVAKAVLDAAREAYNSAANVEKAEIEVANQTYTGKALEPAVKVTLGGNVLTQGTDYTVTYSNNVNAGTAKVTVVGAGIFCGETEVNFTIRKAAGTMTAKGKTATLKAKKLKKKAQSLARKKLLTISKVKGTLTYKKVMVGTKAVNKKVGKKFVINAKTGKLTVKKGVKKGTYKVKVNVTDSGTRNYNKVTRTVVFTVKVK